MLKVINNLDLKSKLLFSFVLVLYTVLVTIIELVSLGSMLPFMAIVNDIDTLKSSEYFIEYSYYIENMNNIKIVTIAGGVVLFLFSVRALIGVHYKYVITRFSQEIYLHTAEKLYSAYLYMPYIEFTNKNTDDMRKAIINESSLFSSLVASILLIFSESLVFFAILIVMFMTDVAATTVIVVVTLSVFILSKFFIAPNISRQGKIRAESQSNLYRLLGQTFGNFKLNKINNKQEKMSIDMTSILKIYTKSQVNYLTLSDIPRYVIETLGFSLIVSIVLYLYNSNDGNVALFMPILTIFAISLFRILPSYNRIITSINNVHFFSSAFDVVAKELSVKQELVGSNVLNFNHKIECKNISFSYRDNHVLKNISFKIYAGETVAIVGVSGSGKTTLVDIIMGLTPTDSGRVCIDGVRLDNTNTKSWRAEIGYIPQDIYLMDGTVRENVLFGREYSDSRVEKALKSANIYHAMQSKNGMETKVGDAGVQLSGGQKQRVGIARAILSNPKVLVFDEGTSALDENTEKEILHELLNNNKGKTIIFITHKKSLINQFDKVITI